MLFSSNIAFGQNAVGNSGTAYNGWLFHQEGLTIGSNLQPQNILHVTNISCDPPCSLPTYIQISNKNSGNTSEFDGFKMGFTDELNLDIVLNQQENANLRFLTNNIERLRINNIGFVGINNNNPTEFLDISGGNIAIRNNFALNRVLTSDANGVGTWQELILNLSSNQLTVNGFSAVDLSAYLDNTDEQTLSISGYDLSINNGNTITLPNEIQELSFNTNTNVLSLSGSSNEIDLDVLSSLNYWNKTSNDIYYNTGKVGIGLTTPASNLHLHNTQASPFNKALPSGGGNQEDDPPVSQHVTTTFQLTNTNTGEEESDGLVIQSSDYDAIFNLQESGNMSFFSNNNTGLYLKNNGNVGIGTTTPQSCLHIHNSTPASGGGDEAGSQTGKSGEGIVTIQLTNAITGTSENDGLFISAKQNDAIINLNETGSFDIKLKGQTAFKIYENKDVQIPSLSGSGFRVLVADFSGKLKIADENMEFDNLGNHTATESLKMETNNIIDANNIYSKQNIITRGNGSWITMKSKDEDKSWYLFNNESNSNTDDAKKISFVYRDGTNYNWNIISMNGETGNVGIGTNNPKADLHINNGISTVLIGDETSTINSAIKIYGNNSEYAYIQAGSENNNGKLKICRYNSTWENLIDFQIHSDNVYIDGKVGIGTSTPSEKLTVNGKILAEEVEVVADVNNYPDYVFENNYKLMSITELEKFITKNNHLPEVPTTADVSKNNMKLGEMNVLLLKKVEELTLYIISLQKQINELKEE